MSFRTLPLSVVLLGFVGCDPPSTAMVSDDGYDSPPDLTLAEDGDAIAIGAMVAASEYALSRFKQSHATAAATTSLVASVHVQPREDLFCVINCPLFPPPISGMSRRFAVAMGGSDVVATGPHIRLKLAVPRDDPDVQAVVATLYTHGMDRDVFQRYYMTVTRVGERFVVTLVGEEIAGVMRVVSFPAYAQATYHWTDDDIDTWIDNFTNAYNDLNWDVDPHAQLCGGYGNTRVAIINDRSLDTIIHEGVHHGGGGESDAYWAQEHCPVMY